MSLVLIAEDEEALLEVFSEVVEDLGHRVVRAHNGEEALLLARTEPPDLVVSDHMMPRRTGMQLLHALRSEPGLSDVPFLLLSAARPPGREAAQTFLAKPVDLSTFEQAVSAALQHREASRAPSTAAPREPATAMSLAREEMLNWVAHELKTPLSSARLNAQLLMRKVHKRGHEDEVRSAEAVLRQLDRMNGLVTSILDASRLADGKLELKREPTLLLPFLQELVQEWRDLQPELEFHLEDPGEPVEPLSLDRERLRQVLSNLLSNAVKYRGPSRRIEVGVTLNPGLVLVHVRDQGVGIPASALPHIFDRFQRVDEDRGSGHGLGLYIATELARLHGGSLSVRSTLGEGSTFTLRLPRRS